MNFENIGNAIAKIYRKDDDKKKPITYISVAPLQEQNKINMIEAIGTPDNESIQHLPFQDLKGGNNRQILYINGASGSGKSYYTAMYIKEYLKMFTKNNVYIFSSLKEDKKIDELNKTRIKRIKLNEKFVNTPLTIEDFKNSLVVYDDTEMISNEYLAQKLFALKSLIMTTGRHTNTFYIETCHLPGGHQNKLLLAEAFSVTLFLGNMGAKSAHRFLENAFGFNTKQVRMIRNIKSRWVTIFRTTPLTVMYEHGMFHIINKE